MYMRTHFALIVGVVLLSAGVVMGQPVPGVPPPPPPGGQPLPPPPAPAKATVDVPPPKDLVAAAVNGQAIPELAVYRGLVRVPPEGKAAARKDVLNFLIDNTIVDQYLVQLKLVIEPKDIEQHIDKMKVEAKEAGQDFADLLKKLEITEAELRQELVSALRWDKFVLQQGTDKALRDLFDKNKEMFDGSRMKARHILRPVPDGKKDIAIGEIAAIKQAIDAEVAQELAKLPANADAITREKTRVGAIDKAFAAGAAKHSTCPSKNDGGDLGFFPRAGAMVEPFARVAFALKPFQMSDPVATEFGYHLILATDIKPGKTVAYEQVKSYVQEVYAERLREAILTHYKGKSKIEIMTLKK